MEEKNMRLDRAFNGSRALVLLEEPCANKLLLWQAAGHHKAIVRRAARCWSNRCERAWMRGYVFHLGLDHGT